MTFIDPAVEHPLFGKPEPIVAPEKPLPLVHQIWQPMETAPKDGTVIIASGYYGPRRTHVDTLAMAIKYQDGIWVRANDYGIAVECFPIRWIPIPD